MDKVKTLFLIICFACILSVLPIYAEGQLNYKDSKTAKGLESALFISIDPKIIVTTEGKSIQYTINYKNNLFVSLDDTFVTDIIKGIEYLYAEPEPTYITENTIIWNLGDLPARAAGSIKLVAKIKPDIDDGLNFIETSHVSGKGYIRLDRSLSTATTTTITNHAYITAFYLDKKIIASDTANHTLFGTDMETKMHGSGDFVEDNRIRLLSSASTAKLDNDISLRYGYAVIGLPNNRSMQFNSKWSLGASDKDYQTGITVREQYSYATKIDRYCYVSMEEDKPNQRNFDSSFEGSASINIFKQADSNEKSSNTYRYLSKENYLGSFRVMEKIERGDFFERYVNGNGLVAVDIHGFGSSKTSEFGSGNYNVESKMERNELIKDINLLYTPINYSYTPRFHINLSERWYERSVYHDSKDIGGSKSIIEKYSGINYLDKVSEARDLIVKTDSNFSGISELKVNSYNSNIEEIYQGTYRIKRYAKLSEEKTKQKYNSHLKISKIGKVDPLDNSVINFIITITNDGEVDLHAILIRDFIPPDTIFISSLSQTKQITSDFIVWGVPNLRVGETATIEFRLGIMKQIDELINHVNVQAYDRNGNLFDDDSVSITSLTWTEECSLPKKSISYKASVDIEDPKLVNFEININNYEDHIIQITITNKISEDMSVINYSMEPLSNYSNELIWRNILLDPGNSKNITYSARVFDDNIYINEATVKAISENISWIDKAIVFVQIGVKAQFNASEMKIDDEISECSLWEIPSCFEIESSLFQNNSCKSCKDILS